MVNSHILIFLSFKKLRFSAHLILNLPNFLVVLILIVVLFQRFTNNNASIGGIRVFNIVTESMLPEYKVGDILRAAEGDLAPTGCVTENCVRKDKCKTFEFWQGLDKAIEIEQARLEIIQKYGHLNEEGHRMVAETLYSFLKGSDGK